MNAASGPAPQWARKRYALPAPALSLFIGVDIGNDSEDTKANAKRVTAKP